MPPESAPSPILDARVNAVIERLRANRHGPAGGGPRQNQAAEDPYAYTEFGFSIHPEQGDLIYLLCRSIAATRVVEFATSVGMSTLYFAAAVRDNGGGRVIGSELVPAKVRRARENLVEAGLAEWVDIRRAGNPARHWRPGGFCADRWVAGPRRPEPRASGDGTARAPNPERRHRDERQWRGRLSRVRPRSRERVSIGHSPDQKGHGTLRQGGLGCSGGANGSGPIGAGITEYEYFGRSREAGP